MKVFPIKQHLILAFLTIGFFVTNCITSPIPGYLFTSTGHTVYDNPQGLTLSTAKILKMGESCSSGAGITFIYPLYYGTGNSIEEARLRAGIQKIAIIDRTSTGILFGIFHTECIRVWGE